MKKILVTGGGSSKDPGFEDIKIEDKPYKEFMEEKGIIVIDNLIESCHGCPDRMTDYSKQMQNIVNDGNRVVAVLEGGLTFGLPSIQATQTTFPIISYPLDLVSYQAFILPTGHSVIAGVGIDCNKKYQKIRTLNLAERILNLEGDEVTIIQDDSNGKLGEQLEKFGIKYTTDLSKKNGLSLAYGSPTNLNDVFPGTSIFRADSDEDLKSWAYLNKAEGRHHQGMYNKIPAAQVEGYKNLAIYAAKILSLQKPELREKIKQIGVNKLNSYGEQRDIIHEVNMKGGN